MAEVLSTTPCLCNSVKRRATIEWIDDHIVIWSHLAGKTGGDEIHVSLAAFHRGQLERKAAEIVNAARIIAAGRAQRHAVKKMASRQTAEKAISGT